MPSAIIQNIRARRRAREQCVAHHPRRHADDQHPLHAEPPEHERHRQHEEHLRHLSQRLRRRDVLDLRGFEEELGVVVVRGERDADQQRADDEHPERFAAELLHRVESATLRNDTGCPAADGGVCGSVKAVESEQDARDAREVERPRRLLCRHPAGRNWVST
jgi:hypothetical protein